MRGCRYVRDRRQSSQRGGRAAGLMGLWKQGEQDHFFASWDHGFFLPLWDLGCAAGLRGSGLLAAL